MTSKLFNLITIKFSNLSIMNKLILCFSLVIFLFLISSTINFTYFKSDKNNSALSIVTQNNHQIMCEIDLELENLCDLTKFPLFYDDTDLSYAANTSSENNYNTLKSLENTNNSTESIFALQNRINSVLESVFLLNKNLHSVFLFNTKGDGFYKIKSGSLYKSFNPSKDKWFYNSIKKFGTATIVPTYKLKDVSDSSKSNYVFGISRGLVKYSDSKVVGVILINTDITVLANIINKSIIYPSQEILIVDSENNIIYDTNTKKIGTKINFSCLIKSTAASKHMKVNGVNSLITKAHSSTYDWTIINIIPTKSLNANVNSLQIKFYFFIFLFIILSIFMILILSKQIIDPIKNLSAIMKLVEAGNLKVNVISKNKDEIGDLANSFNSMTQKINELINEVYTNKLKQKDIELQMLQNQINPHFIYNTLESIHMMAEINNDKEVSKMSVILGQILRYGLSNKTKPVTVHDEISNLKHYLMLQEIRFDNLENINIDIDSSLYNKEILKLTFQPIIENALYHGLNSMETGGRVSIIGKNIGLNMTFCISDNGLGMDETQVSLLNEYINGGNENFKSIGLKNVNTRIKLHYGSNYGIKIKSKLNLGTKVIVLLPCITFKET
ncbi:sensor histidine kinase [Clostridium felsineum]|uniref:Uncharacterized protein n=1 Tax=Clostridium felsineum TaxID=36839 RepID=A0A1S8L241_9CLOT|nr:sensor histidine kinase [Clostridium felsineum]URZ04776.1 hypothetical protein CLROS_000910 [Clostridium felsineum]URZ09817.1 hypothetical protein CROST_005160 [Clostridium felsineum]